MTDATDAAHARRPLRPAGSAELQAELRDAAYLPVVLTVSSAIAPLVKRARDLAEPTPCRRADPTLWFSASPADLESAKRLCRGCPLRAPCLAGAIERAEPWGVWGGEIIERGLIVTQKRGPGRPRREERQGRERAGVIRAVGSGLNGS